MALPEPAWQHVAEKPLRPNPTAPLAMPFDGRQDVRHRPTGDERSVCGLRPSASIRAGWSCRFHLRLWRMMLTPAGHLTSDLTLFHLSPGSRVHLRAESVWVGLVQGRGLCSIFRNAKVIAIAAAIVRACSTTWCGNESRHFIWPSGCRKNDGGS